jgi:nucleoside 2-deoxyribosyltransferase
MSPTPGLKIYLAARFRRKRELRRYKRQLERAGFVCTARWLLDESSDEGAGTAARDVAVVQRADYLVLFGEEPRTPTRHGRMVEFGIAIALQKNLIVIGGRGENIFTLLDEVEHFATWRECFQALTQVSLRHVWSGPGV